MVKGQKEGFAEAVRKNLRREYTLGILTGKWSPPATPAAPVVSPVPVVPTPTPEQAATETIDKMKGKQKIVTDSKGMAPYLPGESKQLALDKAGKEVHVFKKGDDVYEVRIGNKGSFDLTYLGTAIVSGNDIVSAKVDGDVSVPGSELKVEMLKSEAEEAKTTKELDTVMQKISNIGQSEVKVEGEQVETEEERNARLWAAYLKRTAGETPTVLSGEMVPPAEQLSEKEQQKSILNSMVKKHGPLPKEHKMSYVMPATQNVTGQDTTTLRLCEIGLRTSTTRSYPLGKVGEEITFDGSDSLFRVTGTHRITKDNMSNPSFIEELSRTEGWTVDAIKTMRRLARSITAPKYNS
jgi:hypothetical protein